MKGNRSIRHVELEHLDDEGGEKVLNAWEPFLENNPNLESFVMEDCFRIHHDTIRCLMDALINRDSPLDSFALDYCEIYDEGVKEITSTFNCNPKMTPKTISLNSNRIGDEGCYFLSELISNDECKLEEISLIENESVGLTGI